MSDTTPALDEAFEWLAAASFADRQSPLAPASSLSMGQPMTLTFSAWAPSSPA